MPPRDGLQAAQRLSGEIIRVSQVRGVLVVNLIRNARLRHRALAQIRAAGGRYSCRDQWDEGFLCRCVRFPRLMRDRVLARATEIILHYTSADDEVLRNIARFPEVQSLLLSKTRITDAAMELVAGLRNLQFLIIDNTEITDGGLACLQRLEDLQCLYADHTKLTSNGFRNASWLPAVTVLSIDGTGVDDSIWDYLQHADRLAELSIGDTLVRSLESLRTVRNLTDLCVNGLQLPSDSYTHLAQLSGLRELYLNHTSIADADLPNLQELQQLRSVAIGGTNITDRGLTCFSRLPRLEELVLFDLPITERGIETLRNAPKLKFLCITETAVSMRVFDVLRAMPHLETVFLDQELYDAASDADRTELPCELVPITQ